jgi:hypothetical protein
MKRSIMISLTLCLMMASAVPVSWALNVKEPESREQVAWKKVDCLNQQSVKEFLKNFPDGEFVDRAKEALELQDKMSSIKEGKSEDGFVIPFAVLGEPWKVWQKKAPNRGALGYFAKAGSSMGWFIPRPLSGGKTTRREIFPFDERGLLISPTGDDSIIAFRTGGSMFELFKGIIFETPGNEPMYFGVIKGKGLVHLKGEGKVTLPDGNTTDVR